MSRLLQYYFKTTARLLQDHFNDNLKDHFNFTVCSLLYIFNKLLLFRGRDGGTNYGISKRKDAFKKSGNDYDSRDYAITMTISNMDDASKKKGNDYGMHIQKTYKKSKKTVKKSTKTSKTKKTSKVKIERRSP